MGRCGGGKRYSVTGINVGHAPQRECLGDVVGETVGSAV